MSEGVSQKSEAKVEVGNGKSEVGRPSCALNEILFQVSIQRTKLKSNS